VRTPCGLREAAADRARHGRLRRAPDRHREGVGRMMSFVRGVALILACLAVGTPALGADADAPADSRWSGAATGYYYAMRDEPDFGVGVATLDRGPLHLEGRYNYEARDSGSAFVGWKFSGGDTVTFEVTPIIGGLFGATSGVVPGVEASVGWKSFDIYV